MPLNISEIEINAPAEKVWATLTDPQLVKLWQYGSEVITDWKPGSSIRFRTAWENNVFEQWGIIKEVTPNKLLKYTLFAPAPGREDKPENYFLMSYILTEADGKTILKIEQEDNRSGAKQEALQGEENPVLQALRTVAESQ